MRSTQHGVPGSQGVSRCTIGVLPSRGGVARDGEPVGRAADNARRPKSEAATPLIRPGTRWCSGCFALLSESEHLLSQSEQSKHAAEVAARRGNRGFDAPAAQASATVSARLSYALRDA